MTKRPGRTRKSQHEVAEGITAVLSKHEAWKEVENSTGADLVGAVGVASRT